MMKPRLLPAILTVSGVVCLASTLTLAPGSAGAAESSSLSYRFPEHPRFTASTVAMSPTIRATLAKVKVGATRLDVARALIPASGSMISPIDGFFVKEWVPIPYKDFAYHVDCVFQPVSMNDARYAEARAHEGELRRAGKWPGLDIHDVLRAVSRPYLAPVAEWWVLETCGLPPSARRRLQRLRIGMTRREVLRDFKPANDGLFPPSEPWLLRHLVYHSSDVRIEIDFKPAAMDVQTYAHPEQRAAWFRAHAWFPGDDPDDTVMDFYKPVCVNFSEPAIEVSRLSASDRERLRNLRVGMTRNDVLKTFRQIGGSSVVCPEGPPLRMLFFHVTLSDGLFWRPKVQVRVDLEFERASTCDRSNPSVGREGKPAWEFLRPPMTRAAGSDVVVGFSRPYVYPEKWIAEETADR